MSHSTQNAHGSNKPSRKSTVVTAKSKSRPVATQPKPQPKAPQPKPEPLPKLVKTLRDEHNRDIDPVGDAGREYIVRLYDDPNHRFIGDYKALAKQIYKGRPDLKEDHEQLLRDLENVAPNPKANPEYTILDQQQTEWLFYKHRIAIEDNNDPLPREYDFSYPGW